MRMKLCVQYRAKQKPSLQPSLKFVKCLGAFSYPKLSHFQNYWHPSERMSKALIDAALRISRFKPNLKSQWPKFRRLVKYMSCKVRNTVWNEKNVPLQLEFTMYKLNLQAFYLRPQATSCRCTCIFFLKTLNSDPTGAFYILEKILSAIIFPRIRIHQIKCRTNGNVFWFCFFIFKISLIRTIHFPKSLYS